MSATETGGPPLAWPGQQVLGGPERIGSEQRWRLLLPDGRAAVLGQLLPELSRDPALRRRYLRDVVRLQELALPGVAAVLALGPQPDPLNPQAPPPFRLREDPPGEDLEPWLQRRAPLPVEEATELGAALCDLLHEIHRHGVVLRDLQPQRVRRTSQGLLLLDIGLHRVDVLSTRTAASLLLEGSPYAAPEQLLRTTLDQRADLYSVGVILWRALTGALPFGDAPLLLRERAPLPALSALRQAAGTAGSPEVLAALDALIGRCLAPEPAERPQSAAQVARILRGEEQALVAVAGHTTCQACGAALRLGLRLCLGCGREAVQYRHAGPQVADPEELVLTKITEDADLLRRLRGLLETVAAHGPPPLNFITGNPRMYSKEEQKARLRVPLRLFQGLDPQTAVQLEGRMKELGLTVKRVAPERARRRRRALAGGGGALVAALVAALWAAGGAVAALPVLFAVGVMGAAVGVSLRRQAKLRRGLDLQLRPAPAALPASDPLVARLAALLRGPAAQRPDVLDIVRELALLVQRVVDHRAEWAGGGAELAHLAQPLEPLIGQIEAEVRALGELDGELLQLDEGTLVRALQRSEAREEPQARRAELLDGLDRLRALEDRRSAALHRLLEAASLLRRAVELGLSVHDAEAQHERHVQMALAALSGSG